MNQRYRLILLITAAVSILVIIGSVFIGLVSAPKTEYEDHVSHKRKDTDLEVYEDEILKYKNLISDDEKNVDAYIRIAEAYYQLGDLETAIMYLEQGYELTGSSTLYLMKCDYEDELDELESRNAYIDHEVFDTLGTNRFKEYKSSGVSVIESSSSEVTVRAENMSAKLYFANTDTQPSSVVDSEVKDGSYPNEIILDDPMILFGGGKRLSFARLKELQVKDPRIISTDEFTYAVSFTCRECRAVIECTETGTILSGAANRIVPERSLRKSSTAPEKEEKKPVTDENCTVSGTVRDKSNSGTLSNIRIQFIGKESGNVWADVYSSDSGYYSVSIPKGEFRVNAYGAGYADLSTEINVYGDMGFDLALDPVETVHTYTVSGTVKDAGTGAPLKGARLVFSNNSDHSTAEASSDDNGMYSVTLTADTYTVTVTCEGYDTNVLSLNVEGDAELNVDLNIPGDPDTEGEYCWVFGFITDASTTDAVSGADIYFSSIDGSTADYSCQSESDGYYEAYLETGSYTVTVTCEGFHSVTDSVVVDGEIQKDYTLGTGTPDDEADAYSISGTVSDSDTGAAISGAWVSIYNTDINELIFSVTTDENGSFNVTAIGGNYMITADCEGYQADTMYIVLDGDTALAMALSPAETDDEVIPDDEITPEPEIPDELPDEETGENEIPADIPDDETDEEEIPDEDPILPEESEPAEEETAPDEVPVDTESPEEQ